MVASAAVAVASPDSTGTMWVSSDPDAARENAGASAASAVAVSDTAIVLVKPLSDRCGMPCNAASCAAAIVKSAALTTVRARMVSVVASARSAGVIAARFAGVSAIVTA